MDTMLLYSYVHIYICYKWAYMYVYVHTHTHMHLKKWEESLLCLQMYVENGNAKHSKYKRENLFPINQYIHIYVCICRIFYFEIEKRC